MNRQVTTRIVVTGTLVAIGVLIAVAGILEESSGMIGLGILVIASGYLPMWIRPKTKGQPTP